MGTVTRDMEVPAMTTDGGEPNFTLTRTNAGSMNNYSSSNAGGPPASGDSGSQKEPQKQDTVKITERYKEITNAIEDMSDALEDASKATDRLYGKSRLDYLKK
jgi:hypothetical protein